MDFETFKEFIDFFVEEVLRESFNFVSDNFIEYGLEVGGQYAIKHDLMVIEGRLVWYYILTDEDHIYLVGIGISESSPDNLEEIFDRIIASMTFDITVADYSDSEWRQFLREYEEWVDDFAILAERHLANPTDLSLMRDYLDSMTRMLEWSERASTIELNLAGDDLREYLETLTRITTKLNEVTLTLL
jgi:hypothetical protein